MKKNKILVLGLVAAFVAVLSLTLVSGTWAKYTSTVEGSDTARVAKWSFDSADLTNKTITIDLFKTTIKDSNGTDNETDVATSSTEKIIAPGTQGTGTFALKNTGEVNAKATVTFTVTNTNNIPVKFYAANPNVAEGVTKPNALTGITNADGTDTYTLTSEEVTLVMGAEATNVTLYWEWPFEAVDNIETTDITEDNAYDTTLGIDGTATITVEVTVVFTQVD